MVEIEQFGTATLEVEEQTPIAEIASQLARHIVGLNPQSIGSMEVEKTAKEGEEAENTEGNENKNVESNTLLDQEFLSDPEVTVREMLLENGVCVKKFYRMQCGEDLKEDTEEVEEKIRS